MVCKACILRDVGDASLVHPLAASDLVQVSAGRFLLKGGLALLLAEGRKGSEYTPPWGMYV